ncbi:MAG: DUF5686 and carboxypeptidase regulatory-like domain-containing protein [Bacteroidales bacterium]|nr:DUF5686 and carboxypeptidase regulatory-like domain-containing protein [Bacteroidales bacterium]
MRAFLLFLLTIFCSFIASAQSIRGRVINSKNDPIPYSTVYIKEISQGLVADEQGKFQAKLAQGTYTLEISSMGFETQRRVIQTPSTNQEIEFQLTEKIYELNEVVARLTKEDPAYRIMRYTIANAPFHLHQVASYTSENYLKGSVKIEKIPTLMKMMIKDDGIKALIGKLMVMESHNEILFHLPNKYTQHVIAYKTSIPKSLEPKGGIQISTSSIYNPEISRKISPLSPQAFKYYKFKFERIYSEGSLQINQIRVIPKVESSTLFDGKIYITEDDWNVYAIDLSITEMGTTTRYKVNYQEVKPSVFLPITFDTYTNIGTLGVKGFGRFYSSVKYKSIILNESAALVPKRKLDNSKENFKQEKVRSQIEQLSAKEKLSTKDALKLALLSSKMMESDEQQKQQQSLEVKDIETVKMQIDSLASKRDSTFWENVRNVPLGKDEAESFLHVDSLPVSKSVQTSNNSITIGISSSGKSSKWLFGNEVKLGKNATISFDGLLKAVAKEYNFVDGFWLGQRIGLKISTSKTTKLIVSPSIYYTTARKSAVWDVCNKLQYAPFSNGQLRLSVGNTTSDIQDETSTLRFTNSLSSLFFGDNAIRFYKNQFFHLDNEVDLANGLRLTTAISYEKRSLLTNSTSFHLLGNAPKPNYFNEAYRTIFPDHINSAAVVKLTYTPHQKYRLRDGYKEYLNSSFPTFNVVFEKALPLLSSKNQSSYSELTFSIDQTVSLSRFSKLNYALSAGGFTSKRTIFAPDYHYFATSPLLFTHHSFNNTFSLLDNYTSSTNRWMESHITWSSDYLLLKRLKPLQRKIFDESLQWNQLWNIRNEKPITEIGYSIGLPDLGRIGIFAGFNGFAHRGTEIKISLPLLNWFGEK